MAHATHNLLRALVLAPTPMPMPMTMPMPQGVRAGSPRVQPLRPRRTGVGSLPLSSGTFWTGNLVVLAILQLLTGALAAPWRQLDDGGAGGGGGGGGGGTTGGARAGQNGEEEAAGVYTPDGGGVGGDGSSSGLKGTSHQQ